MVAGRRTSEQQGRSLGNDDLRMRPDPTLFRAAGRAAIASSATDAEQDSTVAASKGPASEWAIGPAATSIPTIRMMSTSPARSSSGLTPSSGVVIVE